MHNFHKMIVKVHFEEDFAKNNLPVPGFFPIEHFTPVGSQDYGGPSRGLKNTTVVTINVILRLYSQRSRASLTALSYQDHLEKGLLDIST